MDIHGVLGLLDIASRLYAAAVLVALGSICYRVAKGDGVLFRRLTWVWFCVSIPFLLNTVGIIEETFEVLPNIDLRCIIRNWMWAAHLVAGTAGWLFWSALNTQHPKGA